MDPRPLVLVIAIAALATGCGSKETKPDPAPAPAATTTAPSPAPAAAPVVSKPVCPPEPVNKKTAAKSKTTKKSAAKPVDCEPAKPAQVASTKAAEPTPAPAPATAPAATPTKESAKPAEEGKPRTVKSRDGTFEGEVYGNIPANSKWAKLQIGMEQPEVESILGVSHDVHAYPTGKAFIPFYYGTDRTRYEVRYPNQGSVSYTGGSWGGGRGVLMMINYEPKK